MTKIDIIYRLGWSALLCIALGLIIIGYTKVESPSFIKAYTVGIFLLFFGFVFLALFHHHRILVAPNELSRKVKGTDIRFSRRKKRKS
jgi:hypothetical protein